MFLEPIQEESVVLNVRLSLMSKANQKMRDKMNKLHLNPPLKKREMKQNNCGLHLATIFLDVQNVLVN